MRSGVRTPSGPLDTKRVKAGQRIRPFLLCAILCPPRGLLYGRTLRLYLRLQLFDFCLVVDLQLGESVFQAFGCRVDVALRDENAGVASNLLDRERICAGFPKSR